MLKTTRTCIASTPTMPAMAFATPALAVKLSTKAAGLCTLIIREPRIVIASTVCVVAVVVEVMVDEVMVVVVFVEERVVVDVELVVVVVCVVYVEVLDVVLDVRVVLVIVVVFVIVLVVVVVVHQSRSCPVSGLFHLYHLGEWLGKLCDNGSFKHVPSRSAPSHEPALAD